MTLHIVQYEVTVVQIFLSSNCSQLIFVVLKCCNVSGIGRDFWSIQNLVFLDLSSNSLRGELPQEIGNMTSLKLLELSKNSLSGQLPNTIGGCKSLESMYLSSNNFVGDIPMSLGQLTNLTAFDISNNGFNGKHIQQFCWWYVEVIRTTNPIDDF